MLGLFSIWVRLQRQLVSFGFNRKLRSKDQQIEELEKNVEHYKVELEEKTATCTITIRTLEIRGPGLIGNKLRQKCHRQGAGEQGAGEQGSRGAGEQGRGGREGSVGRKESARREVTGEYVSNMGGFFPPTLPTLPTPPTLLLS